MGQQFGGEVGVLVEQHRPRVLTRRGEALHEIAFHVFEVGIHQVFSHVRSLGAARPRVTGRRRPLRRCRRGRDRPSVAARAPPPPGSSGGEPQRVEDVAVHDQHVVQDVPSQGNPRGESPGARHRRVRLARRQVDHPAVPVTAGKAVYRFARHTFRDLQPAGLEVGLQRPPILMTNEGTARKLAASRQPITAPRFPQRVATV